MKTIKLLIVLAVTIIAVQNSFSQSAVYYCPQTGAYAYCYAAGDAAACAYAKCIEYGGIAPVLVTYTDGVGTGVIVEGKNSDGKRVIGVGLGYGDYLSAFNRAVQEYYFSGGVNEPTQVAQWTDGNDKNTN